MQQHRDNSSFGVSAANRLACSLFHFVQIIDDDVACTVALYMVMLLAQLSFSSLSAVAAGVLVYQQQSSVRAHCLIVLWWPAACRVSVLRPHWALGGVHMRQHAQVQTHAADPTWIT
jgi:hypothetical protein